MSLVLAHGEFSAPINPARVTRIRPLSARRDDEILRENRRFVDMYILRSIAFIYAPHFSSVDVEIIRLRLRDGALANPFAVDKRWTIFS